MTLTVKALESGRVLLSAAERRPYTRAEAYLRRRCGMGVATAEPVFCDEVLFLELTRLALAGDLERVDRIIEEIAKVIPIQAPISVMLVTLRALSCAAHDRGSRADLRGETDEECTGAAYTQRRFLFRSPSSAGAAPTQREHDVVRNQPTGIRPERLLTGI